MTIASIVGANQITSFASGISGANITSASGNASGDASGNANKKEDDNLQITVADNFKEQKQKSNKKNIENKIVFNDAKKNNK